MGRHRYYYFEHKNRRKSSRLTCKAIRKYGMLPDVKNINSIADNGNTCLSAASIRGDLEYVKVITQMGGSMDVLNRDGTKPIHVAAKVGHESIVEYFINNGMDINCKDDNNRTALHYAAEYNKLDIVKMLSRKRADLNCKGPKGMTPMHLAAKHGYLKIVQYLFTVEAKFDSRNRDGHTPLLLAAVHGHLPVVEFLVSSTTADVGHYVVDRWTLLHHAAQNGWTEVAKHLVQRGVRLDNKTVCGQTAVLLAARNCHKDIFVLLVESGADLASDSSDRDKWSVLHHAVFYGWEEMISLLLDKGVDMNARNSSGDTPLLFAAKSKPAMVEVLLKVGADVTCVNAQMYSLLHWASDQGWVELVEYCLKKGCDIDLQTLDGRTPLFEACHAKQLEAADYLMSSGADCGVATNAGKMPFTCLINQYSPYKDADHLEAIRLFVENGSYFDYWSKSMFLDDASLLDQVLLDVKLCTQAILNKYNNKDLKELYQFPFSKSLPPIEKMTIRKGQFVVSVIEQDVKNDILMRERCDLNKIRPMVLSMKCVKVLIKYSNKVNKRNRH